MISVTLLLSDEGLEGMLHTDALKPASQNENLIVLLLY